MKYFFAPVSQRHWISPSGASFLHPGAHLGREMEETKGPHPFSNSLGEGIQRPTLPNPVWGGEDGFKLRHGFPSDEIGQ